MAKVAVYGAGSWGTALAQVLACNGHEVTLWGRNEAQMQDIAESRENKKYLPGVTLHPTLRVTSAWPAAGDYDYLLIGVPTQSQRGLLESHREEFQAAAGVLINVAKGIETATGKCVHEVYMDVLGDGVCLIEWGEAYERLFGEERLDVHVARMGDEAAEGEEPPRRVSLVSHDPRSAAVVEQLAARLGDAHGERSGADAPGEGAER